ncbi:MAG: 2'-5' RNA ligase family protein [Desulfitobacterium sp.]
MKYAVNLYFNKQAENEIRDIWKELSALDSGKCMACDNGRPHITLAIYDNLSLDMAQERIQELAEEITSFKLRLLQIGIFPHNKGAIFLTPNLIDELFYIHRQLHQIFQDYEEQGSDYYKPQAWYPHCTLSLETPLADIPEVLGHILKIFSPIDVTIESIGIVSLDPIEYLFETTLKKGGKDDGMDKDSLRSSS